MFGNLVESGSHRAEARRKGKYFLATLAFYGLLLVASGVGSIYAYNVRLDQRDEYELVALMRLTHEQPARAAEPERRGPGRPNPSPARSAPRARPSELSVENPNLQDRPFASASTPISSRRLAAKLGPFGGISSDGGYPSGAEIGGLPAGGAGPSDGPTIVAHAPPPAAPPKATPTPAPSPRQGGAVILTSEVISGKAVEKPAPPYPTPAKMVGAQGSVPVVIVVDEQGRVVSAKASGGHPLLRQAAVQAAYRARFEPTRLGGQPVKVTGVITYNFVLR